MKKGLPLAIVALTTLAVAAVAYRVFHRAGPRPPDPLPAGALPAVPVQRHSVSPETGSSALTPSAPPPEPIGVALSRLADLIRRAQDLERPPSPDDDAPQDPAAGMQEEEARVKTETEGRRLADRLRAEEPEVWIAFVDGLAALEDDNAAVRVAAMAAPGLVEDTERILAEVLGRDNRPRARKAAVSALAGRDSAQSLAALARASSADPDTDLRLRALKALSDRRLRSRNPGTIRAVEEALSKSAGADPELRVRQAAARLLRLSRTPSAPRPGPAATPPAFPPE